MTIRECAHQVPTDTCPTCSLVPALEASIQIVRERDRYREALHSIANSTCCGDCQEAALVARAVLAGVKPAHPDVVRAERRAAWEAVNKHIKMGKLQGNGCDETAQRNGLILAANLLRERLDEVQS
jgi:hypothetical protein